MPIQSLNRPPASNAVLYPADGEPVAGVRFQFNPETIQITHGANLRELGVEKAGENEFQGKPDTGSSSLPAQAILEKAGKTSLKLSKLTFDGRNVLADCAKLMNWSYAIEDGKGDSTLKQLHFSWCDFRLGAGTKNAITVVMTKCDVTYTRFTAKGVPVRATVTMDLQPQAKNPFMQNPTSAGLANRQAHSVVSGESLVGIARTKYGHPTHWRRLAELNGIDDPLRTRPGQILYLPDRSELLEAAPR